MFLNDGGTWVNLGDRTPKCGLWGGGGVLREVELDTGENLLLLI